MNKEKLLSIFLGLAFLVAGVFILFTILSYASGIIDNPQSKLNEFVDEETNGPTASFQWYSTNRTVDFYDYSSKGDANIVYYLWDFGDGEISNEISPKHIYSSYGNYTVTLTVQDENGENDSIKTKVSTQEGVDTGQALKGFDLSILNLGNTFKNMLVISLLIGALAIVVLIGGKILLTGARLIRPTSENLKIKSKDGVVLEVTKEKKSKKTEKKPAKDKPKPEEKKPEEQSVTQQDDIDKEQEMNDFFEGKA